MTKHKWHDEIVAWAGGAEIDAKSADNWFTDDDPSWNNSDYVFRIKPPDIYKCQKQTCSALKEKKYLYAFQSGWSVVFSIVRNENSQFYLGKIEVLDD